LPLKEESKKAVSEPHYVNIAALEPLFAPHEEPARHRVRAEADGQPARVITGRRKTPIAIAQSLRPVVKTWRENDYPGSSDTPRELLRHWFARDHLMETDSRERVPFRYYFCQREAIETLIYLNEVRDVVTLSGLVGEFGGENAETAALGVNPDEDRWAKYALKLATGAGKTKVMSLAIVWSYFHALREPESPMAKHFVVIAPNLTVFERLKEDFKPARGGGDIFDRDPLIPLAWRGDWNLTVVLQDEVSGAATGGTLYLTNVHRLMTRAPARAESWRRMTGWDRWFRAPRRWMPHCVVEDLEGPPLTDGNELHQKCVQPAGRPAWSSGRLRAAQRQAPAMMMSPLT
jgi:type III restriction enzyme